MPKNSSTKNKTTDQPRKLKVSNYSSFKLQKKVTPTLSKIPSSFKLFKQSIKVLTGHWKLFLGIAAVMALLNFIMAQGFFSVDLSSTKDSLSATMSGFWGKLGGGVSLLSYLAGNTGGTGSDATSAYRIILTVIGSLATIWALRLVISEPGVKARIRDSFYEGMYPLIPFVLVFLVILVQIIPIAIVTYFYSVAGAVSGVEVALWFVVFAFVGIFSLYMVCSSVFALYIACLPGMSPMAALKSARALVRYRRLIVIRRLLFLPLVLAIILGIILIPILLTVTALAVWIFFILVMIGLPVIHSYMYALYRSLLHEE